MNKNKINVYIVPVLYINPFANDGTQKYRFENFIYFYLFIFIFIYFLCVREVLLRECYFILSVTEAITCN